jgi:ERCC4-related helicase
MFNVLVTTPKAFEVAQSRGVASLAWGNFNAVVFDEVHHAIKDHPYRNLALKLKHSTSNPRVIGLTASLTYAVGDEKINKSVGKLCQELGIEKIESATDEELRSGGYTGAGRGAIAEVRLPDMTMTDHLVPIQDRKPHLMHSTFFDRIKKSTATSFSTTLVNTIRVLEDAVKLDMHDFKSPLSNVSLKTWGEYAKKKSNRHAMFLVLEHFYEALKLLVISWEEHQDIALIYLQMMKVDSAIPSNKQPQATSAIKAFFETQWRSVSLGRLENLYKVLNEKLQDYGQDFRCILFVKQRLTTHILKYAIESHTILGNRVTAQCIYSTKTSNSITLCFKASIQRCDKSF